MKRKRSMFILCMEKRLELIMDALIDNANWKAAGITIKKIVMGIDCIGYHVIAVGNADYALLAAIQTRGMNLVECGKISHNITIERLVWNTEEN